jgi:hypothetical protein
MEEDMVLETQVLEKREADLCAVNVKISAKSKFS